MFRLYIAIIRLKHVVGLHTVKMSLDCEPASFVFSLFMYN